MDIKPELAEQLRKAYYLWFTTVRSDGMPQPTPVWFVQDGETFLIYSAPDAQKIRNIESNPKVALSFTGDHEAESYVVVMGQATLESQITPAHQFSPYFDKYETGIEGLGMTPEGFGQTFSVGIRVTPERVRGE
jgi:PPOX class probable F420-dependent enzyme